MDDENKDQGLRPDMGKYVEEARDYNPEDPDDSDESLIDKVKNVLGGDDDETDEEDDEEMMEEDEGLVESDTEMRG